jgi:hypothetical protein
MSFTNNYSQVTINEINKNFEFLIDSTSISDRSFHIHFKLGMDLDMLEYQATTFSENFKSHGYINFFKTLRIPESEVFRALHDLYIYSYAKCLYNGLNYSTISEKADLGYAFRGHGALFYILRSPGHSEFYKKRMSISWNLDLGNESYKQALLIKLIAQYPFLKTFRSYSLDTFGTKPFMIQKFEAYFNYLTEDFYSRDNVQQGEQNKAEGPRSFANATNGKIILVRMNESHTSSMSSFSLNPIMNAFLSANNKDFYFVPVGNGKSVENNPSLFFSKANFIGLRDNKYNIDKIMRTYRSIPVDSNLLHTVCSEVFTNTGIICRFLSVNSINKETNKWPIEKLGELISNIKDKTPTEIIDAILERIGEIDFDDLYNELLNLEDSK